VRDHGGLHVLEIDRMSEAFLHGGHNSAVMAARPYLQELPQVRRHIERKAVERHAPPHREPDRRDLLVPDPDAPLGSLPGRVDPEVGTGTEEHVLEVRHEPFHLEAVRESEDRVADELPSPVIGRFATPFDLHDLPARIEDVLPLPTTAEGRDGFVFDEDQSIRDALPRATVDDRGPATRRPGQSRSDARLPSSPAWSQRFNTWIASPRAASALSMIASGKVGC